MTIFGEGEILGGWVRGALKNQLGQGGRRKNLAIKLRA